MILAFPNLDAFRLVLGGGFVSTDTASSPASVSFDEAGQIFLDTPARFSKKVAAELAKLGITPTKRMPGEPTPVSCWLQVVPLTKTGASPNLSQQAPVLFELPTSADLSALASEMLRLGNDRQSFRWTTADDASPRVLLRVIGPPYYSLLRALEGPEGGIRAYLEQAPRVWVQLGYMHPFAPQVKVAEGQMLLVRPPREWTFLADEPFRDIYEVTNFPLPASPTAWQGAAVESKIAVPLKLVAGNAADAAELWVLRGNATAQLDAFVRDADDRITQRLKFAVGSNSTGEQVVVLRTTASKLAPPVLPLADALGYKPFWKIPNLYVPAGRRLHPTLRRDVVRKLLADDADRLVWLAPDENGRFTPESLPEDSFRPLEDWVDYLIEANPAPLAAWIEASRFAFEPFICTDTAEKPKDKGPAKKRAGAKDDDVEPAPATAQPVQKPQPDESKSVPTAFLAEPEVKPPSEWMLRRKELEDRFLAVEGQLDAAERAALWPDLAEANAGTGDAAEAALCWINAAWGTATPPAAWLDRWMRTELPDLPRSMTASEFDRRMKPADPSPLEMRQFAAILLAVAYQASPPSWLRERLPAVQRYLEANEHKLPIRAVWLAGARLAQLGGADLLGLARVRDRVLQRLLEDGLNAERNVPSFLRFAGHKDSARVRLARDSAMELHRTIRSWTEKGLKAPSLGGQPDNGATLGYIDLFFAFAMAKLDESTAANELVISARRVLTAGKPDEQRRICGELLLKAFQYRIDETLAGRIHSGPLPNAIYEELDALQAHAKAGHNTPQGQAHYAISRLSEQSRILEPQDKVDPYRQYTADHRGEVIKALVALPRIKEAAQLGRAIRELNRTASQQPDPDNIRLAVLLDTLPLSARVSESLTVELIGAVPTALRVGESNKSQPPPFKEQGKLLERALFLAAHFDRRDLVQQLVDQFIELVQTRTGDARYELINIVASQSLRSLRKLGLQDEIDRMLRRLNEAIQKGLAQSKGKSTNKIDTAKALQSRLALAGGWLTYGLADQANPIVNEARTELLSEPSRHLPRQYAPLAQAYIASVGHGPAETALPRILEFFREAPPARVANGWTTSQCYSRDHLNLAEEVVLALVSDDFALGTSGRRWLEEDEYLIRRRIHADMKRQLDRGGV